MGYKKNKPKQPTKQKTINLWIQVAMQGFAWNSPGSGILFLWLSHVYTQINVAAMGGGECIFQTAEIAKNQLSEPGTGLASELPRF